MSECLLHWSAPWLQKALLGCILRLKIISENPYLWENLHGAGSREHLQIFEHKASPIGKHQTLSSVNNSAWMPTHPLSTSWSAQNIQITLESMKNNSITSYVIPLSSQNLTIHKTSFWGLKSKQLNNSNQLYNLTLILYYQSC